MSELVLVRKRAIDVTPLVHAVWCQIENGEPFANPIVLRRWSEDGTRIVFMLDSHNFMFSDADGEIEVIETEPLYNAELTREELKRDAERMKAPASPNRPNDLLNY